MLYRKYNNDRKRSMYTYFYSLGLLERNSEVLSTALLVSRSLSKTALNGFSESIVSTDYLTDNVVKSNACSENTTVLTSTPALRSFPC